MFKIFLKKITFLTYISFISPAMIKMSTNQHKMTPRPDKLVTKDMELYQVITNDFSSFN